MKKTISFPWVSTLICLFLGVIFFFLGRLFIPVNVLLLACYLTRMVYYFGSLLETDSFKNPNTISCRDNGKAYRVVEIKEGKVGLVRWGKKDSGSLGNLEGFKTYYFISEFSQDFLKLGKIFIIFVHPWGNSFSEMNDEFKRIIAL